MLFIFTINLKSKENTFYKIYDGTVIHKEPITTKNIPIDVIWDEKLGLYLNDDFYYDPISKAYKEKLYTSWTYKESEASRNEKWLKKVAPTNNVFYLAFTHYLNDSFNSYSFKELINSGPRDLYQEEAFQKHLTNFDYKVIKDIMYLLYDENVYNEQMIGLMEYYANVTCFTNGKTYYDLNGTEKMVEQWKVTLIDNLNRISSNQPPIEGTSVGVFDIQSAHTDKEKENFKDKFIQEIIETYKDFNNN